MGWSKTRSQDGIYFQVFAILDGALMGLNEAHWKWTIQRHVRDFSTTLTAMINDKHTIDETNPRIYIICIFLYIYIFIYLFGSLPGDTMSLPSGPSASMLFFGQSQKFRSPAVGSAGFDVTRNDSSSIIFNCHFRDLNWRYLPYIYIYTHIMYIYYVYIYILCIYIYI